MFNVTRTALVGSLYPLLGIAGGPAAGCAPRDRADSYASGTDSPDAADRSDAGTPADRPAPQTSLDGAIPADGSSAPPGSPWPWSFVVVGDTHVTATGAPLPDLVPAILNEGPQLVLVAGDIVQTGRGTSADEMQAQLSMFHQLMEPLYANGIAVYPVRGNHENDANDSVAAWRASFTGARALPANGPGGEEGLSYSVQFKNALFVAIDEYVTIHRVNQPWLDSLLADNSLPHVFVFGHEPAFKYFHGDCLDDQPEARNAFWTSLSRGGAKVYLAGHDHFRDLARVDDGDGDLDNDVYQYIVGTGGGPFPPMPGGLTGDNSPFTPVSLAHAVENGYLLVEVSGGESTDRDVTMTFKRRSCDPSGVACQYLSADDGFRYTATGPVSGWVNRSQRAASTGAPPRGAQTSGIGKPANTPGPARPQRARR